MAPAARVPGRSITSRALAVLACFAPSRTDLSLSELSRATGSAAVDGPSACCRAGAVGRADPTSRRYAVGPRLWDLGLLAPVSLALRDAAPPFLQDISAATGENAYLAVRDGTDALSIERIAGRTAVPIVSRSGSRLPLHATGVGKVLLAFGPEDLVEQTLHKSERLTPYTVTGRGALLRQLANVRRRGYALTGEKMTPGTSSVAVPVPADGVVAAGLVASTSLRDLVRPVPTLAVTARGIARATADLGAHSRGTGRPDGA